MFSTCARYAAFGWTLDGPDRTVNIYHKVLHQSEHGGGYHKLALKVLQDLFTQDNGAFVEVERTDDDSQAPAVHEPDYEIRRLYILTYEVKDTYSSGTKL
jgi:hypothetical protein